MRKTLKRNLSYDDRNHLSCVSLYYDGENGRRVRRTRTYPTMEQAEQVIAEYRRAQLLGGRSAPGDVFMEDWLRYWMDELIKPNCEETTCHGYENILNTHMIPSLGRLYVQDLTPVRVQQYYGELRRKGLANNTIRKHHVLLHAALGAAVRQGVVGANVTCLVTPPAREAPQHRFYDSSQLRMLFCASEGTPLEVAVKLAGCLGLRRSEICGLKWRNVDLKRGVLTVCEVRTAVSGRALEKAPKSYASERRLAFGGSEDLEALLKRLYRDWERRRKQDPKTPRATSPSTRRESLISRTFCAGVSRSSSPRRASRRSRSTGCATALRESPTDRMCRCSASRRRWGTAQHP